MSLLEFEFLVEQSMGEKKFKSEMKRIMFDELYPQLYPPFTHHVSVLDLLFNCGDKSLEYIVRRS